MFNEINKINPTVDFDPALANLKAKLRAAWMGGDYAAFSAYMKPGATKILTGWRIEWGVQPPERQTRASSDATSAIRR